MQPEGANELISAGASRQAIYSFLARAYAVELTEDALKDIAEKRDLWVKLAKESEAQDSMMCEGFGALARFASGLKIENLKLDDVKLKLDVDYAGLFLGVWQTPPHPSESVYSSSEHRIMQKARDDVLMIYRSMGLDKIGEFREPEDHIAIELQFMAQLAGKTNEALRINRISEAKKYLEVQRDFVNDHLGKWVPKLAADIMKQAIQEFYKAVAKITEGFVRVDSGVILEMIDSLTAPSGSDADVKSS